MRRYLFLLAATTLSSCAFTPETGELSPALPVSYQTEINEPAESVEIGRWWLGFDDPVLTSLIDAAQANNKTIEQSVVQIDLALTQTRAIRSDLFPTLDAFFTNQFSSPLTSGFDLTSTGSLGADASFTPDIYGRGQSRLDAAISDLQASALSASDVRRAITEAVALQYTQLRRAGARLELLQSTLDLQERTLEIVRSRYDAGLSPKLDVDRTSADLARTRAQKSLFEADRKQAEFGLAVLTGAPPGTELGISAPTNAIPDFQLNLSVGVPADLIRRRPDIRAAEARFLAELERVNVERADLYPTLRIPGQVRAGFGDVSGLSDEISYSISAMVDIPLLDFGRRQAEVDAQRVRVKSAALAYEIAVLNALQEVENALVDIDAIQKSRNEQLIAAESSTAAYDQLDALYREGLASFIDVLDAQRTLISSRESLVQTEANLAIAMIALYSALDIGCHDADLPGCSAVDIDGIEAVLETAATSPDSTEETVLPG